MIFDMSGMTQAFKQMEKNALSKGTTVVEQQARKLKSIAMNVAKKEAPTDQDIDEVLKKWGNRIKIKGKAKKKSVVQKRGRPWGFRQGDPRNGVWKPPTDEVVLKEIARRKRATKTLARNWRITRKDVKKTGVGIGIDNETKYSAFQDAQHHMLARAMKHRAASFKKELDRLAAKVTSVFG